MFGKKERKFDDLASKCDKQEKLLFVIGDLGTAKEERKQQIENEPYPVYFQQVNDNLKIEAKHLFFQYKANAFLGV